MKTREQLLEELCDILEAGNSSHTDAVNGLSDLLSAEAEASPGEPWVEKFKAIPEPR